MKKLRKRSEIPAEFKWHIEDLYPSDEAFEAALLSVAIVSSTGMELLFRMSYTP